MVLFLVKLYKSWVVYCTYHAHLSFCCVSLSTCYEIHYKEVDVFFLCFLF